MNHKVNQEYINKKQELLGMKEFYILKNKDNSEDNNSNTSIFEENKNVFRSIFTFGAYIIAFYLYKCEKTKNFFGQE